MYKVLFESLAKQKNFSKNFSRKILENHPLPLAKPLQFGCSVNFTSDLNGFGLLF